MPSETPRALRLLVLTSSWPVLGAPAAGVFVERHCRALVRLGHLVTVLRPGPAAGCSPFLDGAGGGSGLRVLQVPVRAHDPGTFLGRGFPEELRRHPAAATADLVRVMARMAARTRDLAPSHDLVIAHWALPAGLAVARALGRARPWILWLHSSDVVALERLPGGARLAAHLASRAARVLAVSRDLARRFELRGRLPEGSVRVLHPGIEPGPEPAPFPPGPLRVLFLGRLERIKGVERIPALARHRPAWRWTVAGDGALRPSLLRAARRDAALCVPGPVAPGEVRRCLDAHHVLLLPGPRRALLRSEGLPTVLLEAMAAGRPMVAGRSGGVGEVVDDAVGASVRPGCAADILRALDALSEDPERLSACGARARLRALGFDVRLSASRLLESVALPPAAGPSGRP